MVSILTVALLTTAPALAAGGPAPQTSGGQSQEQSGSQPEESEILLLPELSEAEQLREALSRTEVLIGERLALFSSLASECKECASTLVEGTAESAERLALLGGTWEPWGEQGKTDWAALEFELPDPVVPPPFTVEGTAAYMLATSRNQLKLIGSADSVVGSAASDLGALLVARVLSAGRLASTFDFSGSAALAALPSEAYPRFELEPTSESADPDAENDGEKSEDQVSQPDEAQSGGTEAREADQAALVTFDCVAQSLTSGLRDLDSESPEYTARRNLAVELQNRTALLAAAGLPDLREPRCQLQDPPDIPQAWLAVVLADVQLLGSEYPGVREVAAEWTFQDTLSLTREAPETRATDLGLVGSVGSGDSE